MYNDDDNEYESLEQLLYIFAEIKNGLTPSRFLEAEDYEVLFDYFIKNNRVKDAHLALETGIIYHPFSIELLLIKADLHYETNNVQQALQTLDKIDEITEHCIEAIILRCDILVEIGKEVEALQFINQRIDSNPSTQKIELLLYLSDLHDELANFDQVFDTLVRILDIDAENYEALHRLSFWAELADKNKESVTLHQRLIDKNPFNPIVWYNLASAHHSLKDYPAAIDAYAYALALDDKLEAAYRNIADAYIKTKQFDKAIEALQDNLEIGNPEDVIYEAMAQCFEKKKEYNKARYYYRQAIKLSPADDTFFYKIGGTYLREEKYAEAYEAFHSAYKLNPENYLYSYALGQCLVSLEREKESVIQYLKSISLKPNYKNTWIGLARALYELGLYEEMLLQMDAAMSYCGEKAEFEYIKVAALLALGKTKEAGQHLHTAMQLSPSKFKLLQSYHADVLTRKSISDIWTLYKKK